MELPKPLNLIDGSKFEVKVSFPEGMIFNDDTERLCNLIIDIIDKNSNKVLFAENFTSLFLKIININNPEFLYDRDNEMELEPIDKPISKNKVLKRLTEELDWRENQIETAMEMQKKGIKNESVPRWEGAVFVLKHLIIPFIEGL